MEPARRFPLPWSHYVRLLAVAKETAQRGLSQVREILQESGIGLVIRGHAHWTQPVAEFDDGLQVLNVDARVVVLTP